MEFFKKEASTVRKTRTTSAQKKKTRKNPVAKTGKAGLSVEIDYAAAGKHLADALHSFAKACEVLQPKEAYTTYWTTELTP